MLLSSDATAAAVEICSPDDFYKPAHGHIFAAIAALFARGEPVDAVTVTDELNRSGLMEVVGDPGVLLSLQISTPSTANALHYARIVEEHALLRRLVGVAGQIAEIGYSVPEDVAGAVDEAERLVFDVGSAARRTPWSRSRTCSARASTASRRSPRIRAPSPVWRPATTTSTTSSPGCRRRA